MEVRIPFLALSGTFRFRMSKRDYFSRLHLTFETFQSTGGFYAVSRLAGATPPPPYVISRGVGWQGIGLFLNGFWGTFTGTTVAP